MKEWLYALFCIGSFLIGMVVAADVAVQVRHKLTGSPLAHKVFEDIIKAKDQTIKTQSKTIATLEAALRTERARIEELKAKEEQDG